MSAFGIHRGALVETPSTSGRGAPRWLPHSQGRLPSRRTLLAQPQPALAGSRPAASTAGAVLCSSLRKERKKLSKVLKSSRKSLESKLAALAITEADSPVLSELLLELRTLNERLASHRAAALLQAADDSSSSDSSDDDECDTRSAAALCVRRGASTASQRQQPAAQQGVPTSQQRDYRPAQPASSPDTLVVSGLRGELEIPVPQPQQGWDWDEDEFRAARFEGAGGRIMVCTGSKCQRKGATEVLRAVSALSEGNPQIEVVPCKCVGKCSAGAALRVRPQGQACATYTEVRPAQLQAVFDQHFSAPAEVAAPAEPITCCTDCVEHTGPVELTSQVVMA